MGQVSHFRQLETWQEAHKYFFILSRDLEYISSGEALMAQAESVGRLLNGLIKSTERRK